MTMNARLPTPTSEEMRLEQEKKDRSARRKAMSKHFTGHGAAVRATPGNMLSALTHYPEWKGVLGFDNTRGEVVFVKDPPLQDFDKRYRLVQPSNLLLIAIWLEREADMVLDTTEHLTMLERVVRFVASRQIINQDPPKA